MHIHLSTLHQHRKIHYAFVVLCLFFSAYQEQIAEAFMPTLRTLFIAPTSSPLAQIDVSNVAELLVHLTSDKHIVNSSQTTTQNENNTDDVQVSREIPNFWHWL
jgi:hypothetical protein